jgi:lipoate-protein ligase A
MTDWLLIDDAPAGGARNMAVDEFLLRRIENGGGAPVLRLYSFSPPAVTIGYHQDAEKAIDVAAALADGIDVVRRITGGRALLHAGELTYSVSAAVGPPFGQALADTFESIAGVIVGALRSIGVDAVLGGARHVGVESSMTSPCLVSTSRHEITAGGKKISGSAQRRAGGAFIQHGSVLMRGGSERITKYLRGDWKGLGNAMTTVEAETGCPDLDRKLRGGIIDLFSDMMGTGPGELTLTPPDTAAIEIIEADRGAEFLSGKAER